MPRFLKKAVLLALIVGLVWLAVIVWWQETHTLPTEGDIALYLGVLPLGLLLAGWLGAKGIRAARAPKSNPTADTAPATAPESATPASLRLCALGAAAQAGAGITLAAIRQSAARSAGAQLDPVLVNHQGFPIMSVRADLDTPALREAALADGAPPGSTADDVLRALALLEPVLHSLAQQARDCVSTPSAPLAQREWPPLHAELLLPAHWSDQAVARAAVQARAAMAWPDQALSVSIHRAASHDDPDAALERLRAWNAAPASEHDTDLRLIAACESAIAPSIVDAWERNGCLLDSAHPQGHLPGEAAAGLLLDLGRLAASRPAATVLSLSPVVQRATSADARGAAIEPAVAALADTFLQQEAQPVETVACLISDADHRGSRAIETLGLAASAFGHLDPNQDCLPVGHTCGAIGATAGLLTLAMAVDACQTSGVPALAFITQHPTARSFALVAPSPIPDA